jgi:hypothetical protein
MFFPTTTSTQIRKSTFHLHVVELVPSLSVFKFYIFFPFKELCGGPPKWLLKIEEIN